MKKGLLGWFLSLSAGLFAQGDITFSCSYTGSGAVLTAHGFETDDLESVPEISDLVKRILKLHHVPTHKIQVQVSSEVNNASAAARGGRPYILYSQYFVKNLQSLPDGAWKIMGIFAHEVGHHLLFHTMEASKSRPDLELEADTWAGSTLYQMGAELEQALSCCEAVSLKGSSTHPVRHLRKQAMEAGWLEAKNADNRPKPEPVVSKKVIPAPAFRLVKRDFTETSTGVSFEMKFLSSNTFPMGSTGSDAYDDEKKVHSVTLSEFYMAKYEVTVEEYLKFCEATNSNWPQWLEKGNEYHVEKGSNQYYSEKGYSRRGSKNLPIVGVNWDNATAYCNWLSSTTGKIYKLPTEAQWEYAARGGETYKYAGSSDIGNIAWYSSNGDSKPHPVGQKAANGFGLHDMSGNVWEWCEDYYSDYDSNSQSNPIGAASGSNRVFRGGSGYDVARYCRVSYRNNGAPAYRYRSLGFRVVCLSQ